ncbi:hypothetical protein EV361DRAFT_918858 [Lentinula raphanica]|nr:hypothetical protein EV361DRAFT_918858 [Lentinula raphanica]
MHLLSRIPLASFALCLIIRCVDGTPVPPWDDDDDDTHAIFGNVPQVESILPSTGVLITVGDGVQALPQNVHHELKRISRKALSHWENKVPSHYHVVNPISNSVEASKIPSLTFLFSCVTSQYCTPQYPCSATKTATDWIALSDTTRRSTKIPSKL